MPRRLYKDEIIKFRDEIINLLKEVIDNELLVQEKYNDLLLYVENDNTLILGNIHEDKLISLLWAYKRNFGGLNRMHISYLIVDKQFRNRGLAKKLIILLDNMKEEFKCNTVDLNVSPDNQTACNLYESLGFKVEKILLSKKMEGNRIV